MNLYTAAVTLILVMDPLGNIPIFLSLLKNVEPSRRRKIIMRESFIAFLFLLLFAFAGRFILKGLGLSEAALSMAGGIVLFIIAIRLIFPGNNDQNTKFPGGEPFIVPMAIPLIAGPSSMAMVSIFTNQPDTSIWTVVLAIIVASSVGTMFLLLSEPLRRLLSDRGLIAVERLMGMILTIMAIQMFLNGIADFIKTV